MFTQLITIIALIFFLSACQKINFNSNDQSSIQSGLQNAEGSLSNASNFSGALNEVGGIDLSGQAEINLPGITPPAVSFGKTENRKSDEGIRMISGRLIPVADKEGKTVVGWRIVGELYNDNEQLFDNGQIMIGINDRILSAEQIQAGGFLPVEVKERMAYDALIGEAFQSENVTVGVRLVDESNPYVRINVENIKFNQKNPAKFIVSGTIRNTMAKSIIGPIVRFWVVSKEEVIAVGTWQAPQDVLASGQIREFESEIGALTGADKEKLESDEVELSAVGAAKKL